MNELLVILAISSIILTAIGQILLKRGANPIKAYPGIPSSLKPYLNTNTILGYSILLFVTILSIYILTDLPLKMFFPVFISGNIIAIEILSKVILHESLSSQKILGISLILTGVLIFSF